MNASLAIARAKAAVARLPERRKKELEAEFNRARDAAEFHRTYRRPS